MAPPAPAVPTAHADLPPVTRWPQLAQQAIDKKPPKKKTKEDRAKRYFRSKTMATVRRMQKGLKIDRKRNACPVCKLPQIEEADKLYLWGVDVPTLCEKYAIDPTQYNRHTWSHHLDQKRFQHPADLYKGFIEQMNFKDASPDAKLALAMRAIDRMVDLEQKGKLANPAEDAQAVAQMNQLLNERPAAPEPEYNPDEDDVMQEVEEEEEEPEADEEAPAP